MTKHVLIVSPHTDDGELGCGGTIARFIEEGYKITYLALSACEKSVPCDYEQDILRHEVKKATRVLGIDNLILLDFEVRKFAGMRQDILDALILIRDEIRPNIVFTPSSFDMHQDHKTTYEETLRAFKQCTILGYEQPWNNITFHTLAFTALQNRHIVRKVQALGCYETQKDRPYFREDFIRGLAITRGLQANEPFAEAFEVIKWIIRNGDLV